MAPVFPLVDPLGDQRPDASRSWLPWAGLASSAVLLLAIAPRAEAASFNYRNFSDSSSLSLVGDVKTDGTALRLTAAEQEWQANAAWHHTSQDITDGFETTFRFRISNPRSADNLYQGNSVIDSSGNIGGDGFAFVLRNSAAPALGYAGGGLGYSGIFNALAIEFDTWDNSDDFARWGDAGLDGTGRESSNHISIQALTSGVQGEFPRYSLGYTDSIADLSNGEVHEARLRYEGNRLSLFLNSILALEVADLDLASIIDAPQATLGFTASSGAAWQNNDLLSWSYDGLEPPTNRSLLAPRAVPEPSGLLGLVGLVGAAAIRRRRSQPARAIA